MGQELYDQIERQRGPARPGGAPPRGGRRPGQGMNWIRLDRRLAIYARDGDSCGFCQTAGGGRGYGLSLDHLVPSSQGGRNQGTNLVTCCNRCNSEKKDRPLHDFVHTTLRERGHNPATVENRLHALINTPVDREEGQRRMEHRRQVPSPPRAELRAKAEDNVERQRQKEARKKNAKKARKKATPKAVVTGKRGGKYYVTPSGRKIYVGKGARA